MRSMSQWMVLVVVFVVNALVGPNGSAAAQTVVDIVDGDGPELHQALEGAAARGGFTKIRLAEGGRYRVDNEILLDFPVEASIELDGRGASLTVREVDRLDGESKGLLVGPNLSLRVADLEFHFDSDFDPLVAAFSPGIEVQGDLEMDRVSIVDSVLEFRVIEVFGSGRFQARNLTVANNQVTCLFIGFGGCLPGYGIGVSAPASVRLEHATLAVGPDFDVSPFRGRTVDAVLEIGNSIIAQGCGNQRSVDGWPGPVSLGGNMAQDSCEWLSDDDLVADVPLPAPMSINGSIPVIAVPDFFPSIDLGVEALCAETDARGVPRTIPCDAGAYERTFDATPLTEGGWNGLWFNAESDGHYVTVKENINGDVVLFWNTFDFSGDPAWIFAVAEIGEDDSIVGEAYVNRGGVMSPTGVPQGQAPETWGRFELSFRDCLNGTFRYTTDDPDFPSEAEFSIARVSYDGNLGCSSAD